MEKLSSSGPSPEGATKHTTSIDELRRNQSELLERIKRRRIVSSATGAPASASPSSALNSSGGEPPSPSKDIAATPTPASASLSPPPKAGKTPPAEAPLAAPSTRPLIDSRGYSRADEHRSREPPPSRHPPPPPPRYDQRSGPYDRDPYPYTHAGQRRYEDSYTSGGRRSESPYDPRGYPPPPSSYPYDSHRYPPHDSRGYPPPPEPLYSPIPRHTPHARDTHSPPRVPSRAALPERRPEASSKRDESATSPSAPPPSSSTNNTNGKSDKKEAPVVPAKPAKNDYSQHFVDTQQRPQNFIRDSADLSDRFDEYPKLKELLALKDKLIAERATPPMYLKCDLRSFNLSSLNSKFDVILIDPPWEEYSRRCPAVLGTQDTSPWTISDIMGLHIDSIAENPSFIFLWVGSAEGLDQGRILLRKWGFRRCEDICWVKTNKKATGQSALLTKSEHDKDSIFVRTKEHCLMGIRGTVRRNQDGHLIHANVDTDVIIAPEPPLGSTAKPEELYHIIEHFSQGRRRLELFGEDHNIRPGWVTLGLSLSSSNYSPTVYSGYFQGEKDAHLLPASKEIEELRPKSPPRAAKH